MINLVVSCNSWRCIHQSSIYQLQNEYLIHLSSPVAHNSSSVLHKSIQIHVCGLKGVVIYTWDQFFKDIWEAKDASRYLDFQGGLKRLYK